MIAPRPRRAERGQALVEFTIVLPVLLMILFAIFQFGIAYSDSIQVTNAARAGARSALTARNKTTGTSDAIAAAKASTWSLAEDEMSVDVTPAAPWTGGDLVTVTVRYPYSISLLGVVVADGTLSDTSTARVE